MFRHYCVILRELVVSAQVYQRQLVVIQFQRCQKHMWNCKLYYQQLHLKYLCNLARYWLQALWGWHDSVETCRSVIICEIIVHLMVIVQNNKNIIDVLRKSNCSTSGGVLYKHLTVFHQASYEESSRWQDMNDAWWNTVSCLCRTPPDVEQLLARNTSRILLLLHRAFRWFNYFHTPTYALLSYSNKSALIITLKHLFTYSSYTFRHITCHHQGALVLLPKITG
jgi:hypothetical protein